MNSYIYEYYFQVAVIDHKVPKWSAALLQNIIKCANNQNDWNILAIEVVSILKCFFKNCGLFIENIRDKWIRLIKIFFEIFYVSIEHFVSNIHFS